MPLFRYSLYRAVVLAAAFGALLLAGASPVIAGLLAIVVASAVAYLFLRRQRDATTVWLAERAEARKARRGPSRFAQAVASDEAAEDAADDAADDAH